MPQRLTGESWARVFQEFATSAWRWEAQGVYREPIEEEPMRQFLDGRAPDLSYMDDWLAGVRRATDEGRSFARVRVLTEPLTEYLRFELAVTPRNAEAGEIIRVITEARARELDLPADDFWIFDDERVALMHFDDGGFTHADLITDARTVAGFREIRDRAWQDAIPFSDYLPTP